MHEGEVIDASVMRATWPGVAGHLSATLIDFKVKIDGLRILILVGLVKGPYKTNLSGVLAIYFFLLGQWLNFKLFGITYLVGKIKFKLFFKVSLAKWVLTSCYMEQ